jgi:hypothetical protein
VAADLHNDVVEAAEVANGTAAESLVRISGDD